MKTSLKPTSKYVCLREINSKPQRTLAKVVVSFTSLGRLFAFLKAQEKSTCFEGTVK